MIRQRDKKDGLNVVPFIDIMLVLLCITLMVSTLISQGKINVNLPTSTSAQNLDKKDNFIIKVDKNGLFFVDDKEVSEQILSLNISNLDKNRTVSLQSDKDTRFENFIKLIDILKTHNHENFIITTKTER